MFVVRLRDGRTLKEEDVDWKEIPLKDITSLQLYKHNKVYTVSADGNNVDLIQLKRDLQNVLTGDTRTVERVIGVTIKEEGKDKYSIKMTVDEDTGNVKLTVQKKDGKKWKKL